MAGTIVADTLQNGSGTSTSMDNAINGSAKAWVNFSGSTTPTIRKSYNVSSITYTASYQFGINFTNAFADANYSIVGMSQRDSNNFSIVCILGSATYNSLTTSAAQVTSIENSNSRVAAQTICVAVFD